MNKRNYLALASINGMTCHKLALLVKKQPDFEALSQLSIEEQTELKLPKTFKTSLKKIDWQTIEAMLTWENANDKHHLLIFTDDNYPKLLKHIPDPPLLLFATGKIELLKLDSIAIVGSRHASNQGNDNAFNFGQALARRGYVIISGLAQGIDTSAHKGAIAANGLTIAIMGTGINKVYPQKNQALAQAISNCGLLLSEFPLDTKPMPYNFPKRNRLISGLSLGVIVVEASLKSGSLITARLGLEQGKEIFAMPSSMHNPLAKGCHHLIKQGAKLIESIKDVEEEFPLKNQAKIQDCQQIITKELETNSQDLVKFVGYELTAIYDIMKLSGLEPKILNCHLVDLELKGLIKSVLGGYMRL